MNTRLRNPLLVLALLAALLLTASCTIGNTGLNIDIQDGQLTASVSIGQQAINKLISKAGSEVQVHDDDFVEELHGVDFVEPNIMRAVGLFRLPDGSITAGTIDFTATAVAGTIKLEVAAVDGDGLSLDTPAIRELNDEFAKEFADDVRSQRDGDDVKITNVTVTDDALKVTVSGSLSD